MERKEHLIAKLKNGNFYIIEMENRPDKKQVSFCGREVRPFVVNDDEDTETIKSMVPDYLYSVGMTDDLKDVLERYLDWDDLVDSIVDQWTNEESALAIAHDLDFGEQTVFEGNDEIAFETVSSGQHKIQPKDVACYTVCSLIKSAAGLEQHNGFWEKYHINPDEYETAVKLFNAMYNDTDKEIVDRIAKYL
jgi:hypothetical protein